MPKPTIALSPSKCNRLTVTSCWPSAQVRVAHEGFANGEWQDEGGVPLRPAEARKLAAGLIRLADWIDARRKRNTRLTH